MAYENITVKQITPHIGAEIADIDLSQPLGNQTFQEVHDALIEHQVIFFRDQDITIDQHKAFTRLFGELHIHPAYGTAIEGEPELMVIHADENSTYAAGSAEWHSDVSADEEPPMGSVLYITEVPEVGGDTLFASMYAAYEGLSDAMQQFLSGMTAHHKSDHIYGTHRYQHAAHMRDEEYPSADHPIVRTHPVSGRKGLFVNDSFTSRINGLKANESRAILDMLLEHMRKPDYQCRFNWRPNSIAFWDNRCVQHLALFDYHPQTRHGHRFTVKGDRPV